MFPLPVKLQQLTERIAGDLRWLNLPPKGWLDARSVEGKEVLDVAVVGAGMLGLVTLAALRLLGIERVVAFDRADAGEEGPWVTFARMKTLRTRKEVAGPALGIGSLSFRAWFETQFGTEAFDRLEAIDRSMWMDYLVWYRRVLSLPVNNEARVANLSLRSDGLLEIVVEQAGEARRRLARRVVIATGLDGLGEPQLPDIASTLPSRFRAHGADRIDYSALKGHRVAVVGAGASAMDNAAAALEAGAGRVDIFVRRADIPRVDRFSAVGSKGMTHGFFGLSDKLKWAFMVEGERAQIPPPRHSVLRVSAHPNAFFHLASPIKQLAEEGEQVVITTPKGRYETDFLVFATGFKVDLSARPEWQGIDGRFLRWRDVYTPPPELTYPSLGDYPYLGAGFEFLPAPGQPASVSHVHCFAYPAVPSHGKITSGIPSISDGANRLAGALARSLFVEDGQAHLERFLAVSTPELHGDEWTDADEDIRP